MSPEQMLTFDEFQDMLARLLDVDAARLVPEAYLITDLGVDSLRLVEVLLRLEELGMRLSPDLAWRIQTVGDAYAYYRSQGVAGLEQAGG